MGAWTITLTDTNGNKIEEKKLEMSEEFEEMAKEQEKLWCHCGGAEDPTLETKYVENYMGVNHGWICPRCGKFVQIG